MSKRKCDEMMICVPCNNVYNKKIFVIDNHIYFYSIIDDENMKIFGDYLKPFIRPIFGFRKNKHAREEIFKVSYLSRFI